MKLAELVTIAQNAFRNLPNESLGPPRNPKSPRAPVPDWLPRAEVVAQAREASELRGLAAGDWRPVVLPVREGERIIIESAEPVPQPADPKGPPPSEIEEHGADVLAYYLPFHFHRNWGIYVLASGIAYLAAQLKGGQLTQQDTPLAQAAYDALYAHEHSHFTCEAVSSLIEMATLEGTYQRYFADPDAAGDEEALCNAFALNALKGRGMRQTRKYLADWMKTQGDGYGKFADCVSPEGRRMGRHALARRMVQPRAELSGLVAEAWLYSMLLESPTDVVSPDVVRARLEPLLRSFDQSDLLRVRGKQALLLLSAGDFTGLFHCLERLREEMESQAFDKVWSGPQSPGDAWWVSVEGPRARQEIPTYLVFDRPLPWLRVARPFPKHNGIRIHVRSNDHEPVHFHLFMPPDEELGHGYEWAQSSASSRRATAERERPEKAARLSRPIWSRNPRRTPARIRREGRGSPSRVDMPTVAVHGHALMRPRAEAHPRG